MTVSASFRSYCSNNGKMWNAILFLHRHNRHRVCFCSLDSELPPKSSRWAYDQFQSQDWVHYHAARSLPPFWVSGHQQSNVGTAKWIPARFKSQPITRADWAAKNSSARTGAQRILAQSRLRMARVCFSKFSGQTILFWRS